jgi:hypothetical protein
LESAGKKTTIRYNRDCLEYPATPVLPLFVVDDSKSHTDAREQGAVRVTSVQYKRLDALDEEDARKDGFSSRAKLIDALFSFYGKIDPSDIVCVYEVEIARSGQELIPAKRRARRPRNAPRSRTGSPASSVA